MMFTVKKRRFWGMNFARQFREWNREQNMISVKLRCWRGHRHREWISAEHPNASQLRRMRGRGGYCPVCNWTPDT